MHPALNALFHALEGPLASYFIKPRSIYFLRAEAHPSLKDYSQTHHILGDQSFKPAHTPLTLANLPTTQDAGFCGNEELFDVALFLATRSREENKALMAQALKKLKPKGILIAAQHNDLGAKVLEKDFHKLLPHTQCYSKKHSRVIWAENTNVQKEILQEYTSYQTPHKIPKADFFTKPGVFNYKGIDKGSALLAQALKEAPLKGKGADLGAGWGFLSYEVLKHHAAVEELHLFEAEKEALTLSERNLAPYATKTHFHWADVRMHTFKPMFDFVLSNPPQHTLHATNLSLLEAFMQQAAKALRPRGQLWLVVNQHLMVEKILSSLFRQVTLVHKQHQYKVLQARK